MRLFPSLLSRLFGFLVMLSLTLSVSSWAQSVSPGDGDNTHVNLAKEQLIAAILQQTGVNDLVVQLPSWIDQELRNLQATPLPVNKKELALVRSGLQGNTTKADFARKLTAGLAKRFSRTELESILALLNQPQSKRFQELRKKTANDYVRSEIRSYKAKLKNTSPRGSRVEMMRNLDNRLFRSQIEADLKVELRKNLLASVSLVKSNKVLKEPLLEKELQAYRQRVGEQIYKEALVVYLYLFKRIPSHKLKEMVNLFADPLFNRFMISCHQTLLTDLRASRESLTGSIALAGSGSTSE